jgi:hypothetical protein
MTTNSPSFAFKSIGNSETSATPYSNLNVAPDARRRKKTELCLPPAGTMRWGIRSKAAVVAAIRGGVLTLEEACQRYALSESEYRTWEQGLDIYGLAGLGLAGRQKFRSILNRSAKSPA